MKRFFVVALFLLVIGLVGQSKPVEARPLCVCLKDYKAQMEHSGGQSMKCVDTVSDYRKSISLEGEDLQLYVSRDELIQKDARANLRFRPKNGKCLSSVRDENASRTLLSGSYCNSNSYKHVGPFKMLERKSGARTKTNETAAPSQWVTNFAVETTGKQHTGFAQWGLEEDGKRYLQAVCLGNTKSR